MHFLRYILKTDFTGPAAAAGDLVTPPGKGMRRLAGNPAGVILVIPGTHHFMQVLQKRVRRK